MRDLRTLPDGSSSFGVAINASGQITGFSETADFDLHAFLWDGTTMLDLGTLGGSFSFGNAINAAGQVAGSSYLVGDEIQHAILWDGSTLLDLGTLEDTSSTASAINASGQVTGSTFTADGEVFHAFFWDGTLHDLNALIDPSDPLQSFVTLEFGVDINDLGQILANGFDSRTGAPHAYVVTPILSVTEPGTLALLGLGLLGLGLTRRRAR